MGNAVRRVGVNVRALRKHMGLSQELAAEKAEISTAHWSLIERGGRAAGIPVLEKVAKVLHVDIAVLFMDNADVARAIIKNDFTIVSPGGMHCHQIQERRHG